METGQAASRALRASKDHLGVLITPGTPVHVTLKQRDELTRDLADLVEATHDMLRDEVVSAGATKAVLQGAQTAQQMNPYIEEALKAIPR